MQRTESANLVKTQNIRSAEGVLLITTNIYYLGLSTLSSTMAPLVVPLLVQQFVGSARQATYFGAVRLSALMVALLAQAFMGMLSDRSTLRWGRRRPFIFIGTLADLGLIAAIGYATGLQGMPGYWFLFAMYTLLQISSNTAQGAQQGLIPDLVPENQRGRFSAVKVMFEIPLALILVSFTIGKLIGAGNMWGGILVAVAVLTASMLITMLTPEKPLRQAPPTLDWQPFLRLVLMTAIFTTLILGMGEMVRSVGNLLGGIGSTTLLFIVLGIVGLLAMIVAVGLGVWVSVRISIGEAARNSPSFTWWVVNRLAYLVGAINLSTFVVYFLQARLGLQRDRVAGPASMLLLFVGVSILVFALISAWLADRFPQKRLVAAAGLVAPVGTLLAILAPSLTLIYIGGMIIGAATGLFYTANWALGTKLVPPDQAGRYLGISNLAGAGAGAVGAYIGGPIADYFTVHVPQAPGLGYVLLFAIYGILFLVSAVVLIGVREPRAAQAAKES